MSTEPFYDPAKSYEENFTHGPFGEFSGPAEPLPQKGSLPRSEAPRFRFLGQPVSVPFGIPAGPLLNGRFVKAALDHGYDLPVYKTVRTRKYASHAWPNVLAVSVDGDLEPGTEQLLGHQDYSGELSITNSFGVPSFEPEFWQPDMADAALHAQPGQMVIGSFQGTVPEHSTSASKAAEYIADFAQAARLVSETGVHAIEANLSCPNEGTANLLCFDVERSRAVVEAIRQVAPNTPLMVKCAYFGDDAKLEGFVRAVGPLVEAICSINTIPASIVDNNGAQALPGEGRLWSGVCGRAIQWAGLEMVGRLVRWRERSRLSFAVVGCGGVASAADYARYRQAGADAVMSATGAMWHPALAREVRQSVLELQSV